MIRDRSAVVAGHGCLGGLHFGLRATDQRVKKVKKKGKDVM